MLRAEMQCDHKRTKKKLMAWAVSSRYGHRQYLTPVRACTFCGCVVTEAKK